MTHLPIEEFGKQLIETGDLDPIYVMLNNSNLTPTGKAKFCLAYWCFYHAGFAAYAADQQTDRPHDAGFWETMWTAANNVVRPCPVTKDFRWPRGTERRHFRGATAEKSITYLQKQFPNPVDAIRWIAFGQDPGTELDFRDVFMRVQEWPAFGLWIGFKVADMMDAVLGYQIVFEGTEDYFFDDPKQGALLAHDQWGWRPASGLAVMDAVHRLKAEFKDLRIQTPNGPREPRTQEIETVLCKWKAHRNGHYPVGKDTREILKGLAPWTQHSRTANHLHQVLYQQSQLVGINPI